MANLIALQNSYAANARDVGGQSMMNSLLRRRRGQTLWQ
jgi:hypothetical protein